MTLDPDTHELVTGAIHEHLTSLRLSIPEAVAADLARVAFDAIPQAQMDELPLHALRLVALDRDSAKFVGAGAIEVVMHAGDWTERGRPSTVYVTVMDDHPASAPI